MQVHVRVRPGHPFNRKENGELVTYEAGSQLTVSQHVYERFHDRFECLGDPPPRKAHIRRPPVPNTDDADPAPPTQEEPRIIVTGRQLPPTEPEDENPLKTTPDTAGTARDAGADDEAGDTPKDDGARASSQSTSGAGNGKPRQAKKSSKKKK